MDEKIIAVDFVLSEAEAQALAQFVKRVGWQEIRQNAQNEDEAYLIKSGIAAVQSGLNRAGYSPR
jgi:hypothetical protein